MGRRALEVADILRDHGPAWREANRGHLSLGQLKVMSAIERCRTAALGGHVMRCENDACAYTAIAYNSCRNRHCPKMLWGERRGCCTFGAVQRLPMERLMSQPFDASRSLTALDQDSTIIVVIEMSQSKWLVAAVVPGVERQPLKKLDADKDALLKLLHRWRIEAGRAGRAIKRMAVAYEAGRDGFWLARWLRRHEVEAYVIHPTSIAVSREHRRAKTDRLDTELLMRAFLGWLRGERRHCSMAAIPTAEEEDARRPNRERENLITERTRIINQMKAILVRFGIRTFRPNLRTAAEKLDSLCTAEGTSLSENAHAELHRHLVRLCVIRDQIRAIEQERLRKLATARAGERGPHAMVCLLARVTGIGIETADMLVNEILSRPLRDRKAVARYAGLTGTPDESGRRRREKGLARAGNARVRRGMIESSLGAFSGSKAKAPWPNGLTPEQPTAAATPARP